MGSPAPDLSIVLPAFNEGGNIAPMCRALGAILAPLGRYEIIFVDDGSSDGTLDVLHAAAASDPNVRYVSFTRNFGHQPALRAGLAHARGRAVIIMDADFEHPPELIPQLVTAWRDGSKVVATQRIDEVEKVSAAKRLTSQLYYRLLDAIGDVRIQPGSCDYMLLDRAVVDAVNRMDDQDVVLRAIVRWLGYPMVTVPFVRGVRQHGASKYSLRRMIELAVTGIAAHSVRPLRMAIWLALGFASLGFALLLYSMVSFWLIRHTVAGWTSVMAAVAILGAAQLLVLGIIGEYVGRILRETRKRPTYVVAETEADRSAERMPRLVQSKE